MKAIQETLAAALMALILVGCGTLEKSRSSDVDGVFVHPEAGILAAGSVEITSTPSGEESSVLKFSKSYKYFQSQPDYDLKIHMTGTNSVAQVPAIVRSICDAFKEVAADLHQATSANAFNSPVAAVTGAAK